MDTALHIAPPAWLEAATATCGPLATAEQRMAFVIDLARSHVARAGGGPFAAAVFECASGRLVAAGINLVVASRCSAAHAEVLALSWAQRRLGVFDLGAPGLPAHELVASAEPCLMCTGAVLWSGVRRLVWAAGARDVAAIGFDEGRKRESWAEDLRERGIEVEAGLMRAEAVAVLAAYRDGGGAIYNARAGSPSE